MIYLLDSAVLRYVHNVNCLILVLYEEQKYSMTLPFQLMELLNNEELSDIISWLPSGLGFLIKDKRRFASEVMPVYFKQSKYTSFTRRLNRWQFVIREHGHKKASYFHPQFNRGDRESCMKMSPIPQKQSYKKRSASKQSTHEGAAQQNYASPITIPSVPLSSESATSTTHTPEQISSPITHAAQKEPTAVYVQWQDGKNSCSPSPSDDSTELLRSQQFYDLYVQSLLQEYALHQAELARAEAISLYTVQKIKQEMYKQQLRLAQNASRSAFEVTLMQSYHGL